MAFQELSNSDKKQLEFEVVSKKTRQRLTRLLREAVQHEDINIQIYRQNGAVNIAHNILGLRFYILEADAWGDYHPSEHSWHAGEIEILMHRPDTIQWVETIGDLLQSGIMDLDSVNKILEEEKQSFLFYNESSYGVNDIYVHILTPADIPVENNEKEHPNIRLLVDRMDLALKNNDLSGVLHTSASIFETLAKDIVNLDTVQDKTLASFFDRYRKDSKLPTPVLDYMLDIYKQRNTEPLAGHGSLDMPTITLEQAIVLSEMTKAFVRIERNLAFNEPTIDTKKAKT